ncbi:late expression factor 3 [Erinnyis ello granulovirus]|uniref:Late expression factor 3 n=1 Tax=Erinnyis ello granulovirus TaxID=307444 RepID=A0A097DAQ6_9BBAC|nr:late expression factor 3 [Erinnyis ello granulovirus]AIS92106.1 late expression factor 3 [Erinnyis ello granulovirus]ARX71447.1 late expression factor 3 [Erinnyis ello granulovirus]ARX71577.1 late expression factor 3 [Erinnyis ello granulovirus]ARX71707.1 late expression factor 3 [Erinnyis ello granulovirus]ARX71837.1 late expression factor 3 [Erinnyis ello granulovirus]
MSKRSADTNIVEPSVKKNVITTEQVVILKREFQKGAARVENNVIYKLDCRTVNKKQQNLIYVNSKTDYDAIVENSSYKFTIERRDDKRWHLLEYEMLASEEIVLKAVLLDEDFVNEAEVLVNFYVEGAYAVDDHDCVKIFGVVIVNNNQKQCDLIVKLDGPSCFNFECDESRQQRVKRALTQVYTKMLHKWWVFQVICRKPYCCSLLARDNTAINTSDCDIAVDKTVFKNNVSYMINKRFAVTQLLSVSKCEYISGEKARLMFEFVVENGTMTGSKFNVKEDDAYEIMCDVNSINFEIDIGKRFYCVYNHKVDEPNPFYNITSVVCMDSDNVVTSVF